MKVVKCDNGNICLLLKEMEDVSNRVISANGVDASFEKHVPQMVKNEDTITVFVDHVMEEDHYIEWLAVDYGDQQIIKHFHPGEEPKMEVSYQEGMIAYSYCNKHSLWTNKEIK